MWIGKICLQGYFKPVFELILHSGAPGYSKVYARSALAAVSLFGSDFAGSNPAVRQKRIASGLVLSFGTQNGTLNCVQERFYSEIRYHSAKREMPRQFSRRNAKACLAWKRIPCYPNRCQKSAFRTVPEILKFSAAAFA